MADTTFVPGTVITSDWLNDVNDTVYSLPDSVDVLKGSSKVGHSSQLEYTTGAGNVINAIGRVIQGADNTGVIDCTAIFRAHFDYCIARKLKVILPGGAYLVSGAISNPTAIASGELHIECVGDVTINVDPGATAFNTLLSCYTTAINNATISGGRLTLNGNNRCANGLYIRHAGAKGGSVDIGMVTIKNCKNNNASDTNENQGILIFGRYESVTIRSPIIDTIDRTNTAAGATKGISVSEFEGQCTIDSPEVSRVLCTGGSADADGIAVFGYKPSPPFGSTSGTAQINNPVMRDCQGRSIKSQTTETVVYRPRIYRQMVVSLSVPDIDFQVGGGVLVEPFYEIRLNGATSPLGANYYPLSVQHQCTDRPNRFVMRGGMYRSETQAIRFANITIGAAALGNEATFDDLELQPIGSLATSLFSRAVVEFDAGQVAASTGSTHISVRSIRGNFSGVPVVGHTAFGASVGSKLSLDVSGNENTGAAAANTKILGAVSGSAITSLLRFMYRDNANCNDFVNITSFDYQSLPVGSRFHYDLSTVTASNGPALGASGIAFVEVLGQLNEAATSRSIRVTKDNANAANTVFYTQSGTWGTIK